MKILFESDFFEPDYCMREFKFRAWIISEKKLAKVHSLHLNKKSIIISYSTDYGAGGNRSVTSDDYILEQYTGLKDKNGVEIYEGDILTCKNSHQSPYDSSKNKNIRVVRENLKTHQLGLFSDLKSKYEASGFGLSEVTRGRWEIIGNVHENPELL